MCAESQIYWDSKRKLAGKNWVHKTEIIEIVSGWTDPCWLNGNHFAFQAIFKLVESSGPVVVRVQPLTWLICVFSLLQPFHPMVNLQCSADLRPFLCALYAPVCTEYGRVSLPCRRLCQRAHSDCHTLMEMFGVPWPEEMDCSRYPLFYISLHFKMNIQILSFYHEIKI